MKSEGQKDAAHYWFSTHVVNWMLITWTFLKGFAKQGNYYLISIFRPWRLCREQRTAAWTGAILTSGECWEVTHGAPGGQLPEIRRLMRKQKGLKKCRYLDGSTQEIKNKKQNTECWGIFWVRFRATNRYHEEPLHKNLMWYFHKLYYIMIHTLSANYF